MGRGFSFRLLYRVVFFSFCLIFACFYHGGGSEFDMREDGTEPNKLKDEFKGKSLNVDVSLEQVERVSNLTEKCETNRWPQGAEENLSFKDGTAMKTHRSERIQKSPVNVPRKESTAITSHSNETEWQNDGSKNISSLENQIFHQNRLRETSQSETFASLTTQHLRNRREIHAILESLSECANFTYTIKYEDNYRVWNNFSMMYRSRMYRYNEYRVTDDGLQVCNSSDPLIKQRWRDLIAQEKEVLASKYCNVSMDAFYYSNYTLYTNFTVFFKPTEQSFRRQDYGVTFGYFTICSAKLSLSCNDYLVKVKYGDRYNVLQNFSLFYNNKIYDYREYRLGNEGLEMCASNDTRIRAIWRTRTSWERFKDQYTCRGSVDKLSDARYYTVNKQLTVYYAARSQYITRNDYGVKNGKPYICKEKLRPTSTEYTKEDLLMCNDSILNIKYDDEYKVRTDFSILYKNKVYNYTEYRVLNDSIKICNSTDNDVRNIWKLRNDWVKARMHYKSCIKPIRTGLLTRKYYTVNKQFTVYSGGDGQYFTRNGYGVQNAKLYICEEKFRPTSTHYTQEDLLMCNDSIINMKYDNEYKVRTDFSILYKNKVYDYTEYRVLNDGIKICNSTDNYLRNIWKVRNKWVKATMHYKSCNKPTRAFWFYQEYYTVNKQFTVYSGENGQYLARNEYAVQDAKLYICTEKLRPISTEYTQEDLLMCNDSIINIKYDNEYTVRTDFSILYKNKAYDYTEYRVLNDSIKICNSTDNYVRNIWKVRNKWVMATMLYKSCIKPTRTFWLHRKYYTVNKQFTVYYVSRNQYFTRNDYGVENGKPYICKEQFRPISTEYTQEDLLMCNDSITNIKYDDKYKVRTDFSIFYKNKVYDYTEYRVLNDSIKICNSTDNYVRNIWKVRNKWVKATMHEKSCNKPNRNFWLYRTYYTVNKQFTVYSAPRSQYFTINDYGVEYAKLYICEEKFGPTSSEYTMQEDLLMCNDSIINIKHEDEYKVRTDFSILYKNKVYNYTEYRILNDSIKICNSTDNYVRNIWKVRNKWVKATMHYKSCNKPIRISSLYREYYTVNKQFTVYSGGNGQYLTRNDYWVGNAELYICIEKLRPASRKYTQEDLLMCNDSIVNIKYNDEYTVRTDFSILYKNIVYDYTEYRSILNDGIKICNSTDNYVRNIWKVRNKWVKATMHYKSCNKPITYIQFDRWEYTVLKDFEILISATKKLITEYGYDVIEGKLITCVTECANFTFTIKYEDEYRVWNNFSMMYQGRMYSYDEYRITDDGLQVCNSSDRLIKEKWRNFIVSEKITIAFKHCNASVDGFYFENYTLHTNFTVFLKPTNQNFPRQDYGVILGYFAICSAKLRFSCNDDLIKVKYGEQYNVFKNFSLVYNKKIYDYREYRFSHDSLEMCGSNDSTVQAIWRTRNSWQKSLPASCYRSYKLNARYYTVTKQFAVYSADNGQYFKRNDYAVIDSKPYVCGKENLRPIYVITNFKIIIAPLCALALSIISLLLLLIVYCMLPELRTLPGLNLMSLSFALLLWQIYLVVFLSLYSHVGKLFEIPCARLFVVNKFMTYSIIMNAAVNIYHLRKTFCGNTLVKSDELKKWNRFLKYSFFSWGVPVIITIVYIVLVKEDVLRFDQHIASVKNDVQSSSRFYQRIVFANGSHGDATANEIRIYQRIASFKKNVQSKFNQSTVRWKEDATEDDGRIYQPIVSLKKDAQPELRVDQSTVEDDAKIYQPIVSLKKDVQSSLKFYERIVFENGDGKEDDARIYQQISGDCINGRITPDWSAAVDVYGLQGCLLLYIIGMFIFTAYRIRQKLKASRNIAQKSNVVKRRKFVILLKLSTTTALSYWFPLFISRIVDFDFDIKIVLYTVTLLTGAYIGIAFVFTRRNYQLLKKKYFPANNKPAVNELPLNRL
ncbi:Hypothetical predicted protein [Paramuricea clavata]|uniref:Uncharacterized protein n=1 Tax=Paramuricea clavata TaxID=317549 RepID=A0A7D9DT84_PARCT|nr:Hypothetical predicted protein [Paramuricea clavata]